VTDRTHILSHEHTNRALVGPNVKMFIGDKTLSMGAIGLVMQGDFRLAQVTTEIYSPLGKPMQVTKSINRSDINIFGGESEGDDDDEEEEEEDDDNDESNDEDSSGQGEDFDERSQALVVPTGGGAAGGEGQSGLEDCFDYLSGLHEKLGDEAGAELTENLMEIWDQTRSKCMISSIEDKSIVDVVSKFGLNLRALDQRNDFLLHYALGVSRKEDHQGRPTEPPPSRAFLLKTLISFISPVDNDSWDQEDQRFLEELEKMPTDPQGREVVRKLMPPTEESEEESSRKPKAPLNSEDFLVLDGPVEPGDWVQFYKMDRHKGLLNLKERVKEALSRLLPPALPPSPPPAMPIDASSTREIAPITDITTTNDVPLTKIGALGFSAFSRSLALKNVRPIDKFDLMLEDIEDDDDEDEDADDDDSKGDEDEDMLADLKARAKELNEFEELDKLYEEWETLKKTAAQLSNRVKMLSSQRARRAGLKPKRRIRSEKKRIETQWHDADVLARAIGINHLALTGAFLKVQYSPLEGSDATHLHHHLGSYVLILPPRPKQKIQS